MHIVDDALYFHVAPKHLVTLSGEGVVVVNCEDIVDFLFGLFLTKPLPLYVKHQLAILEEIQQSKPMQLQQADSRSQLVGETLQVFLIGNGVIVAPTAKTPLCGYQFIVEANNKIAELLRQEETYVNE